MDIPRKVFLFLFGQSALSEHKWGSLFFFGGGGGSTLKVLSEFNFGSCRSNINPTLRGILVLVFSLTHHFTDWVITVQITAV
jgi:hypothetical protein